MAGANKIPEKLINFRVYDDKNNALGLATVDLPQIQAMTESVSGSGIAGEIETPLLGHFQSMATTLHWRTIEGDAAALQAHGAHQIDVRGSQQAYDAAGGTYGTVPVRATLKVIPKSFNLGSFEPGSQTDTEQEFEVVYLKLYVDGKERLEIDKANFVFKVDGVDQMATVRADLGMS